MEQGREGGEGEKERGEEGEGGKGEEGRFHITNQLIVTFHSLTLHPAGCHIDLTQPSSNSGETEEFEIACEVSLFTYETHVRTVLCSYAL